LSKRIRIGTRGSQLAIWQANFVKDRLEQLGIETSLEILKTQGDVMQSLSLEKLEGKGFFTTELEEALLASTVDIAVHSMKDLPTQSSDELMVAGVSAREDPADWLIIHKDMVDDNQVLKLKRGATVGTSSNRRKAQLSFIRPDVSSKDIRGNVPTRIGKVTSGEVDAVILAAAGLIRIGIDLTPYSVVKLHPREFVPAPAQGVLAFQTRRDNTYIIDVIRKHLHHADIARITNVERKILRLLEGGCHLPLGAYCTEDALGNFHVWTAYAPSLSEPIKHFKLSYSTTEGLAEAVVKHYLS
jgi:hydroxymethylbilane synthase